MILRLIFILAKCFPLGVFGQDTDYVPSINLETVWFKAESTKLTKNAKITLDSLITQIKSNPKIVVQAIAYNKDLCDKCGVRSWKRATAVLTYLSKHGISDNRLSFTNRLDGELNKVDLLLTSLTQSNISL
jgi:hypothetical protein